ncbi:response regulator transcription factor [Pseudogulbenkiania sp. MAI-1]|uniref:response regulator transcription factor n=1 Tax=Pseudogulbenkiania sp. MAI-1 TaxID=990370 RepID=UPI00045EBF18|nr:response regulator transcription factor [Pseudogulbenkiania sp. MAI-1]
MTPTPEASSHNLVLVVDDVPDNLMMLHDALDEAGHTVLVATNGEDALQRARMSLPDVILLDAVMPGMDGFEVARRLKADAATQPIPIVFMTGLTETEHVVAAFAAGGIDYVTKPLRPMEVLARIAAHVNSARQIQQASSALDAFGQASLSIAANGRITWQTPLARQLLETYFGSGCLFAPVKLMDWTRKAELATREGREVPALLEANEGRRLRASFHDQTGDGEWLVVLREENNAALIGTLMSSFRLTHREAEVLHWLMLGKTNRDIGDILGTSPRTVNKHLEHIFEKLGVETRTAAAALAVTRVRGG